MLLYTFQKTYLGNSISENLFWNIFHIFWKFCYGNLILKILFQVSFQKYENPISKLWKVCFGKVPERVIWKLGHFEILMV